MNAINTVHEERPTEEKSLQEVAKGWLVPFIKKLDAYEIPDDKIQRVIDYAVEIFAKNHRHMKEPRMIRKVAEYFKLKLKKQDNGTSN